MPWYEVSIMEQRREFVRLAMQAGVNRRELCRRFGISPEVGYKWLGRFAAGDTVLADRSRRPHLSPLSSSAEVEALVLAVRDAHPAWGARKIARCLERDGYVPPRFRQCTQSSSVVVGSSCRGERPASLIGGSRKLDRTFFGRWTSKATWHS
jgi:homeodomain-containing protein